MADRRAYARQRRNSVLLLVALLVVLGTALFLYSTPRRSERLEGVITDQYELPSRSGGSSVCRVTTKDRGAVFAACGQLRRLPQTVTVELTESYLFGAPLNRVVSP
jgi:hypothetical protein